MILVLLPNLSHAAFEETQTDARVYGLAGAGVAITDISGCDMSNPAQAAMAEDLTASSGSSVPFAVKELAAFSGSYVFQRERIGAGLGLSTLGGNLYRENHLGGTLAFKFNDRAAVGLSLNCYQLSIERYGSAAAMGLDLGILGKPVNGVALGFTAVNLNRPAIGSACEEISQSLSFGISAEPLNEVTLSMELYCQRDWPNQVRIGQEYRYRDILAIRAGFSDRPNSASLGFGVAIGNIRLGYAARTHPDLGLSHCISVNYITQRIFSGHREMKIESAPAPKIIDKMDPNTASYQDLCLLPGIGPKAAADIIASRDSLGRFEYLDDLAKVRGIGRSTIARLAPFVTLTAKPETPLMVDINSATAEELAALPGIGPKAAADIVAYRLENGPFRNPEDLMNVKGIGRKTYEGLRTFITIGQ